MGEDFVSQRQQRTVEMVRMKNLREEKMLAMRLGNKGGLEASKRYELNRFRKEKQRLMRDLDRMKCLRAKPRYSDSSHPDILTVEKDEGPNNAKDGDAADTKDVPNDPVKDNTAENDVKTYDRTKALIGYYGLSPRVEENDSLPAESRPTSVSVKGLEQNQANSPEHANVVPPSTADNNTNNNADLILSEQILEKSPETSYVAPKTSGAPSRRKGRKKKSKIERMHEKSAAEFRKVQERMHNFMDALNDKQKWEIFCMFDSALKGRGQDEHAGHNGTAGDRIPNISSRDHDRTDHGNSRKSLPLNEINIEAIKEHIQKRLSLGRDSPGSSTSPSYGSSSASKARKKPIIVIDANSDNGPKPELPGIQEHKFDRVRRWTNQHQTIPEGEEPTGDDLDATGGDKPRPRRRTSQRRTLGTIQEGVEKGHPQNSSPQDDRDHGDWSHRPPPIDGVFMNDFVGQVLYDTELFNPDGSFRAKHMVPEFEQSLAEAKKARYIRYGKDDVPEHEKDLTMNEIFGKSEEDNEIYQLIQRKERERAEKGGSVGANSQSEGSPQPSSAKGSA